MEKTQLNLYACADLLNDARDMAAFLSMASCELAYQPRIEDSGRIGNGMYQCFKLMEDLILKVEDELRAVGSQKKKALGGDT